MNLKETLSLLFKYGIHYQMQGIDDIAPNAVSDIETLSYNTNNSGQNQIVGYTVKVTYPGDLHDKFKKKLFIGPKKNPGAKSVKASYIRIKDGNTIVTYAWRPMDWFELEDSRHAAEMFWAARECEIARNKDRVA